MDLIHSNSDWTVWDIFHLTRSELLSTVDAQRNHQAGTTASAAAAPPPLSELLNKTVISF